MPAKISQTFLLLFVVPVFLFSFSTPVYQANFSGTWSLNEGKSELGQFGARAAASKIAIDQKTDAVTLAKTVAGLDGSPANTTETLTADGKEYETTVYGTAKKKSSLKWAADGNTFAIAHTTIFERNGQTFEIKGTETWSLGTDGKTLTIQNQMATPGGDITIKAVYDKQ
jgi:hypothetical protein